MLRGAAPVLRGAAPVLRGAAPVLGAVDLVRVHEQVSLQRRHPRSERAAWQVPKQRRCTPPLPAVAEPYRQTFALGQGLGSRLLPGPQQPSGFGSRAGPQEWRLLLLAGLLPHQQQHRVQPTPPDDPCVEAPGQLRPARPHLLMLRRVQRPVCLLPPVGRYGPSYVPLLRARHPRSARRLGERYGLLVHLAVRLQAAR